MKNKTKVVLGLAAVLAGTVGVAGVSTFAWFTTQNTAQINFADAHVVSDNASFLVKYMPVANNGITDDKVTSGLTQGSTVNIAGCEIESRDISGDGLNFYRPVWSNFASKVASSILPISNSSTKTFYVTFGLQLENKGTANTRVYLGSGSNIYAGSGDAGLGQNAANATRIAVYGGSADGIATQTLKTIWQKDTTDTGHYTYIHANAAVLEADRAYGVAGYELATPAMLQEGALNACTYATVENTAGNHQLLWQFSAQNEIAYLTVSMWIEGTLSTAGDNCIGGNVAFTLNLEGYGLVA